MNIIELRKLAWDVKNVVKFLRTIPVGSVKSTHELADEFCTYHGVVDTASSEWYNVLNNMDAGFQYLLRFGDVKVERDRSGMPFLTFLKDSGMMPR